MQPFRTVATVTLLVVGLAGCAVAGNTDGAAVDAPRATPSPGPRLPFGAGTEPRTLAGAVRLATAESERYVTGDYAGAWALWTPAAQQVFGRSDFVAYHAACPGGRARLTVTGVRLAGPRTAVVRLGAGDSLTTYAPRYQRGHWRWQPTDEDLAFYRLGVAGAIRRATSEGSC